MGSAQLLDPADRHRSRRSKIRRSPSSCKICAARASCRCLSHARCSQTKAPAGLSKPALRPRIFQAVDPDIVKVEPAEFRQVVQKLTGSPGTQRSLRMLIGRSEGMKQNPSVITPEMKLLQQQGTNNSLQEYGHYHELQTGTAPFLGVSADPCANYDRFPSPSSFNPTLISVISDNSARLVQGGVSPLSPTCTDHHASNSTLSYSLGSPRSSAGTNQQIDKLNHPASSLSYSLGSPLSSAGTNQQIDKLNRPASSAASDSAMQKNYSPCSPNSSPSVTSISEMEQAAHWGGVFPEQDSTTDEVQGAIDFFDFSADSYYGDGDAQVCQTTSLGHSFLVS